MGHLFQMLLHSLPPILIYAEFISIRLYGIDLNQIAVGRVAITGLGIQRRALAHIECKCPVEKARNPRPRDKSHHTDYDHGTYPPNHGSLQR